MTLGVLGAADVPAAAALSRSVGWNQDEADWGRLVALHPEGALAARADGELVGTATLVRYGKALAWLGMVIVDPRRRGEGIGAALLDAALAQLAPDDVVGLDATDLGAPLYERRGFARVGAIERWSGALVPPAGGAPVPGTAVRRAAPEDAAALAAFDRSVAGVDRGDLLARLLAEPGTEVLAAVRAEAVVAYAASRTGRERRHVGPVVAADGAALVGVLNAVAAALSGAEVFLDAVQSQDRTLRLEDWGLEVARTLGRMVRPAGADVALLGPGLVAAMGFEWG